VKSNTTVRVTTAVAPFGLVATTFNTVVPAITVTGVLNAPLASGEAVTLVVWNEVSIFVAAIEFALPGDVVPATWTWPVATLDPSSGAVTLAEHGLVDG
jgi:hypothetical protein